MQHTPFVSVIVLAYNSSKYIVDTLNSIKDQSYRNFELIICDDHSSDNTYNLISNWYNNNQKFFEYPIKVIENDKNLGTTKNLNRGILASNGKWLKSIAGDDILKENCLEVFVQATKKNTSSSFFCCDLELFSSTPISEERYNLYKFYFNCVQESFEKKKQRILYRMRLPGPGWFYSRKLYDKVGGFDENYKLMEEWPFAFKALYSGYNILPVKDQLVKYRLSASSISQNMSKHNDIITDFVKDNILFELNVLLPILKEINFPYYHYRKIRLLSKYNKDRSYSLIQLLYKIAQFIDPVFYIGYFYKKKHHF